MSSVLRIDPPAVPAYGQRLHLSQLCPQKGRMRQIDGSVEYGDTDARVAISLFPKLLKILNIHV
jgi:hypothetical protein